jgi:hypothetical protein
MVSSGCTPLAIAPEASNIRDDGGLKLWYRKLDFTAGGGIETLARPTSLVVASVSAYWPLRLDGLRERSFIDDCERDDSPDVVRESGSNVVAMCFSDERCKQLNGCILRLGKPNV